MIEWLVSIFKNDRYIQITHDDEYFVVADSQVVWAARVEDLTDDVLTKVEDLENEGRRPQAYEELCEGVEPIEDPDLLREIQERLDLDQPPKVNW